VIPAQFDYVAAESADHAIELLTAHGDDAKVLAGGHSLLPMMKLRLAEPGLLIDISGVRALAGIAVDGDELVIGAATRHADLAGSALVRADAPLLAHSASLVGDPQIRHRGTIGGSLAHADPAADLPMALVVLGGSVELRGPAGARQVTAGDFFTGFFETCLEPDELLTAVRVPRLPGVSWGYQKFTRRANDWAIVGAAAIAGRIALANMGPVPIRALAAEQALANGSTPAAAAELATEGTSPGEDIHADRGYREHLARVLTRRALEHQS
jgi:carbon-monoxide dehydrogenase medium subunit